MTSQRDAMLALEAHHEARCKRLHDLTGVEVGYSRLSGPAITSSALEHLADLIEAADAMAAEIKELAGASRALLGAENAAARYRTLR